MSNNVNVGLVKAIIELDSSLNEEAVRFVGATEGDDKLREIVRSLILINQLKK